MLLFHKLSQLSSEGELIPPPRFKLREWRLIEVQQTVYSHTALPGFF